MVRTGKSSKKHGSRGSGSRSKESSSSTRQGDPPSMPIVSFFFMVNELRFEYANRDDYHNSVPPTRPERYTAEIVSEVMHYNNGHVSRHPGYLWSRGNLETPPEHTEGMLWPLNPQSDEHYPLDKYSTCAVFACNPHLPIMVCPDDPFANDTTSKWQLLQIHHPRAYPGLSQIAHEDSIMPEGPGLRRYIASSQPRWMPSLVPDTYRWPPLHHITPPPPVGLGGELAIILGLMALTAEPDYTDQNLNTNILFLGDGDHHPSWRSRRWSNTGRPRGHPLVSDDLPMGFLVTIFFDPNNPQGSTEDMLRWFEWTQAIFETMATDVDRLEAKSFHALRVLERL